MNGKVWKWVAASGAAALGLGMMALQKNILQEGFDASGLLLMDNPGLWILWTVTVVFLAGAAVLAWSLGEGGSFEENFPPCPYSGIAGVIAGFVMLFSGLSGLESGLLMALCALAIGVCMVMGGICRCCGWKPDWWMDMVIFAGYTVILVLSYRSWNVAPTLQTYAFPMLSLAAPMLFALHRARLPWGYPDRRRLIFFGLAGVYLSFPAMAGGQGTGFFFATAVWCAGALCELTKQYPEESEVPEEPEEPREAPETVEAEDVTDPVQAMLDALEAEKKQTDELLDS